MLISVVRAAVRVCPASGQALVWLTRPVRIGWPGCRTEAVRYDDISVLIRCLRR
jgi:hypothetical protein